MNNELSPEALTLLKTIDNADDFVPYTEPWEELEQHGFIVFDFSYDGYVNCSLTDSGRDYLAEHEDSERSTLDSDSNRQVGLSS